jgi:hypothetical protein
MAYFLKLTRDDPQSRPIYVNADLIETIVWYETTSGGGHSILRFGNEDATTVRERPDEIIAMLDADRRSLAGM